MTAVQDLSCTDEQEVQEKQGEQGQQGVAGGDGAGRVGPVVLALCIGFALVVVAYALGRRHTPGAAAVFWSGQVLVYGVGLAQALSRRRTGNGRLVVVLLLAAGQAALTYAYSPLVFTFPDELQHWRTATDILATHHLFTVSPTLPVSPEFPGLEIVTVFLVQACHVPLFYAGVLVASASHVLLAGAAYTLYRSMTGDDRVSAVATVLFMTSPHAFAFNGLFLYGALALPFFVLALRAALSRRASGVSWSAVAVASVALTACVVSHPLTALVAIATVALMVPLLVAVRAPRVLAVQCAAAAAAGAAVATVWVVRYARNASGYLGAPLLNLWHGLLEGGASSGAAPLPTVHVNGLEQALILGGVAATAMLIPVGVVVCWRGSRRTAGTVLAVSGLLYFGVLAVRVTDAKGAEIATRGLTYVALLSSLPVAVVLVALTRHRIGRAVALLTALTLVVGSLCSGWPASWERLPGKVWVDGFESGVDPNGLAMSRWATSSLGPDRKVACDFSACTLLGAFSHDFPVEDAADMYYAPRMTEDVARRAAVLNVQYLVVNQMLARQIPVTGRYFRVDTQAGEHVRPVDRAALDKFASDPAVSRIYDDGQYQVYDVRGLWDGP